MPYPPELREQARLLKEAGESYASISRKLGVPDHTISRWFNPEMREKNRLASAAYKKKNPKHGVCVDCGGPTSWQRTKASERCQECRNIWLSENPTWPPEKIIEAIQRWVREHGRPPTAAQWRSRGEWWPAYHSVYGDRAPFPTWRSALQAAGYDTPAFTHKTRGPGKRAWSVEEAKRLRRVGLPDTVIGEHLGVSGSAIYQALGPRGIPRQRNRKRRTREERIADLKKALANGVLNAETETRTRDGSADSEVQAR